MGFHRRGQRVQLPLLVSVRDNGPGIPENIRPHLFEPFLTTKATGSGLGLALAGKIVGDHGGVIEVESRPGRTEVLLHLPVVTEERARRKAPTGPERPIANVAAYHSGRR
ncbi:ATP-binding protein [Komagataeibacter rhaeticus]|nr:ATP-binding protein [Komagataeibacter rhaeticus]